MTDYSRLEITVDVFDLKRQPARPIANLPVRDFITATLAEFREVAYLGNQPEQYQVIDMTSGAVLDNEAAIGVQIKAGAQLALIDRPLAQPQGAESVTTDVYLRETLSGEVYKLHWSPAIIGRSDENIRGEALLITNLESLPRGLRISRRHAQITEQDGAFYIKQLSRNPTKIKDTAHREIYLDNESYQLKHGDQIRLERSGTELTFIERNKIGQANE
ncbi:MAG: FHA domain-containing protein [Candidatus Promineifilaceae bacterium]